MELSELKDGLEVKYVFDDHLNYGVVAEKSDFFEIKWDDNEISKIDKYGGDQYSLSLLENIHFITNEIDCEFNGFPYQIKSIVFDDDGITISHIVLTNKNHTTVVFGDDLNLLELKIKCGKTR